MTRGTFYLFKDNKIYSSVEFNGDMYYNGYGELAANYLKNVKTLEDFERVIKEFNRRKFNYPDRDLFIKDMEFNNGMLNMSNDYFVKYGSDYLFIKNEMGRDLEFILREGDKRILKDGTLGVLNFGRVAKDFKSDLNYFSKKQNGKHEVDIVVLKVEKIKKTISVDANNFDSLLDKETVTSLLQEEGIDENTPVEFAIFDREEGCWIKDYDFDALH